MGEDEKTGKEADKPAAKGQDAGGDAGPAKEPWSIHQEYAKKLKQNAAIVARLKEIHQLNTTQAEELKNAKAKIADLEKRLGVKVEFEKPAPEGEKTEEKKTEEKKTEEKTEANKTIAHGRGWSILDAFSPARWFE